jgi:dTDP-4-dehydrorhamnose reductase
MLEGSRILITGAAGMLARSLSRHLHEAGAATLPLTHAQLDVCDRNAVEKTIVEVAPRIVLHCAAYTAVDQAESERDLAFAINSTATKHVAECCAAVGARLIYPSTDYVFDGAAFSPYAVDAPTAPLNEYGRSKLGGEAAAQTAGDFLIIRTSWLYGPGGRNFVRTIADRLRAGTRVKVVNDQVGCPTWTEDLSAGIVQLIRAKAPAGTYHLVNSGSTSWYGLASAIGELLGAAPDLIEPCTTAEMPRPARRPAYSALDCQATEAIMGPLRPWRVALSEAVNLGAF